LVLLIANEESKWINIKLKNKENHSMKYEIKVQNDSEMKAFRNTKMIE